MKRFCLLLRKSFWFSLFFSFVASKSLVAMEDRLSFIRKLPSYDEVKQAVAKMQETSCPDSRILNGNSMDVLDDYVDEDCLITIDFDYTIACPKTTPIRDGAACIELDKLSAVEGVSEVISRWQSKKALVVLHTNRSKKMFSIVANQLEKMKIDLSTSIIYDKDVSMELERQADFVSGTGIFGNRNDKGNTFKLLTKKTGFERGKLISVDDNWSDVKSMQLAAKSLGIKKFVGLIFSKYHGIRYRSDT